MGRGTELVHEQPLPQGIVSSNKLATWQRRTPAALPVALAHDAPLAELILPPWRDASSLVRFATTLDDRDSQETLGVYFRSCTHAFPTGGARNIKEVACERRGATRRVLLLSHEHHGSEAQSRRATNTKRQKKCPQSPRRSPLDVALLLPFLSLPTFPSWYLPASLISPQPDIPKRTQRRIALHPLS